MSQDKTKKRLRLKTAEDVRRYIQNLMSRVENGEIDLNKARLLMNLADGILKSIRTDELEKRIIEIEEALENK